MPKTENTVGPVLTASEIAEMQDCAEVAILRQRHILSTLTNCHASRSLSMVLTKLDEAVLWLKDDQTNRLRADGYRRAATDTVPAAGTVVPLGRT